MAAAVSGGVHADAGAGPVSGLPSALAGVLNGSAEDTISLKSILEAVQNNQAVDIMETIAGNKLNSETMGNIIDKASEVTHLSTEQADQGNPGLNGKELQVLASLQKALAEGKVPAQSALGNRFRAEVDTQGKTPAEIKKFRLDWASNLMSQLEAKKIASKEWKRVDTTRFIYRPFGALVQHLGVGRCGSNSWRCHRGTTVPRDGTTILQEAPTDGHVELRHSRAELGGNIYSQLAASHQLLHR